MDFATSHPKRVGLSRNGKQTHRLNPKSKDFFLNFQGQIWNLIYFRQKWSDRRERKSIYIELTRRLKFEHLIGPRLWPWPWFFKVKYEICYISGRSATKRKANIDWTRGLKYEHWVWPWPWPCNATCKDLLGSDRVDFSCRRAVE